MKRPLDVLSRGLKAGEKCPLNVEGIFHGLAFPPLWYWICIDCSHSCIFPRTWDAGFGTGTKEQVTSKPGLVISMCHASFTLSVATSGTGEGSESLGGSVACPGPGSQLWQTWMGAQLSECGAGTASALPLGLGPVSRRREAGYTVRCRNVARGHASAARREGPAPHCHAE